MIISQLQTSDCITLPVSLSVVIHCSLLIEESGTLPPRANSVTSLILIQLNKPCKGKLYNVHIYIQLNY